MSRKPVFKTVCDMEKAWEKYKKQCNNTIVPFNEFDKKARENISYQLKKRVSYNIAGFCAFCNISRSAFYNVYKNKSLEFKEFIEKIETECEADTILKFETGELNPKLAPLRLHYKEYEDTKDTDTPIIKGGEDELYE